MRIGELAKACGVSTSRIRFYEAEGLLPAARREPNGYRGYPSEAPAALSLIEGAQRLGFSLKEIAAALPRPYQDQPSCDDMIRLLRGKLADLDRHLLAIRRVRAEIVDHLATLETKTPRSQPVSPADNDAPRLPPRLV